MVKLKKNLKLDERVRIKMSIISKLIKGNERYKMKNDKSTPLKKLILKLIGERFPYLTSLDILLILIFLLEKAGIKRASIHSLAYYVKKDGIPLDYNFYFEKDRIISEELKRDLDNLFDVGYIKCNEEKMIELTIKGKDRVNLLLKTLVASDEEEEIKRSILPIKQLLLE